MSCVLFSGWRLRFAIWSAGCGITVLEPLLPKGAGTGRPPVGPRRQLIDGIRFRVRTGVPWRDVPFERTMEPGLRSVPPMAAERTWHRIFTQFQSLADAKGAITWDMSVDSPVCRAHQHGAGARKQGDAQKEPPGGLFTEPGDHGLGRSRGGFTTNLHLAVEQRQKPTRRTTVSSMHRVAGGRRSSTRTTTTSGTRSSAGSTASRGTAPSPRDTTSRRSATRRPSSSLPSTSGCNQHLRRCPTRP